MDCITFEMDPSSFRAGIRMAVPASEVKSKGNVEPWIFNGIVFHRPGKVEF